MGTANSSNSGNFLVNVEYGFFRPPPPPNAQHTLSLQDMGLSHRGYADLEKYCRSDRSATTWSASLAAATTSSSASTSIPTTTSASTSSSPPGTPSAAAAKATGKSISLQTNTGLSSGAKAGIGVGVALAVLALLAAGLLLWARARRKQRQIPPLESQKREYGGSYAGEVNGNRTLSEMNGRNEQEEKDGFPIAGPHTRAGELEADPAR